MRITTTTTFEVSGVMRAVQPLPEVPYKQAVEALLTEGNPDWEDEWESDEDDLIDDGRAPRRRPKAARRASVRSSAGPHRKAVMT